MFGIDKTIGVEMKLDMLGLFLNDTAEPKDRAYALIAFVYNAMQFPLFFNHITHEDVEQTLSINVPDAAKPRVNASQIIAIAKAVCKVIEFLGASVCPIVDGLSG